MEKYVGIWLNKRKAIIVTVANNRAKTHLILSKAQLPHNLLCKDIFFDLMASVFTTLKPRKQDRVKNQTAIYYNAILDYVQDASDLLIFGPVEAKLELKKMMDHREEFGCKIVQVAMN